MPTSNQSTSTQHSQPALPSPGRECSTLQFRHGTCRESMSIMCRAVESPLHRLSQNLAGGFLSRLCPDKSHVEVKGPLVCGVQNKNAGWVGFMGSSMQRVRPVGCSHHCSSVDRATAMHTVASDAIVCLLTVTPPLLSPQPLLRSAEVQSAKAPSGQPGQTGHERRPKTKARAPKIANQLHRGEESAKSAKGTASAKSAGGILEDLRVLQLQAKCSLHSCWWPRKHSSTYDLLAPSDFPLLLGGQVGLQHVQEVNLQAFFGGKKRRKKHTQNF